MISQARKILKHIRRAVFQKSHLAPYLYFIAESQQQKIARLYADKSYAEDQKGNDDTFTTNANECKGFFKHILLNRRPTLDPCSNRLLIWYALVFCAIMYEFIEVGLMITFGTVAWQSQINSGSASFFNPFFLIILIADIGLQFSSGYLHQGMIIMDKQRVVGRYLYSFFVPDLLQILIIIISLISGSYETNYFKFMRMFQIDRLYLRRLSIHRIRKTLYVIGKQVITIFNLSHVIGLIFYLIDYAIVQTPTCQDNNSLCWLYSSTAHSNIIELSWDLQYFYTLYWGVNTITTISYGDIAPNNPLETIYGVAMFCFGFVVYGYVINSIIKVILWARALEDQFKAEIITMDIFMKDLNIKPEIQTEVHDYIEFVHKQQKNRNLELEQQMKAKLPQDLRLELVRSAYSKINQGLQLIFGIESSATRLLLHIHEKKYTSNQIILSQEAEINSIHYLHKGGLRMECNYGRHNYLLKKIKTIDQFVAMYEYFTAQRIRYNLISEKGSVLYSIDGDTIKQQSLNNRELKESQNLLKYDLQIRQNYQRISYNCFYCQLNHHWYQCVQKFPNFTNVRLGTCKQEDTRRFRTSGPKHHSWRHRDRLLQLQVFKKLLNNDVLSKMERRLKQIREKIHEDKVLFEVDIAHDWNAYLPDHNISKLKEVWNNKKKQRVSLFQAFGVLTGLK